jgi:hypothetical protein
MDPYERALTLARSNLVDELHKHAAFMASWSLGDDEGLTQANASLRRCFQAYDEVVGERTGGLLELWRLVEDDEDEGEEPLSHSSDEAALPDGTAVAVISRFDYIVSELPTSLDELLEGTPVGGLQLTVGPVVKLPVNHVHAWPPAEGDEKSWLIPDGEVLLVDIIDPGAPSE